MKRYSILVISFIVATLLFVILLITQKNVTEQNELAKAYILNKDISMHDNITLDILQTIYVPHNMMLDDIYVNINTLDQIVASSNLKKGTILFNENVINKQEISSNVNNVLVEKVIIPVSNIDNGIGCVLSDNTYINLYVSVNKEQQPHNIDTFEKVYLSKEDKEYVTFLYLSKIRPVCFLNDNGQVINDHDLIKSVVLELNKEQAMYINYIKGKAGFNITVV